jgi:hypothetical protein
VIAPSHAKKEAEVEEVAVVIEVSLQRSAKLTKCFQSATVAANQDTFRAIALIKVVEEVVVVAAEIEVRFKKIFKFNELFFKIAIIVDSLDTSLVNAPLAAAEEDVPVAEAAIVRLK